MNRRPLAWLGVAAIALVVSLLVSSSGGNFGVAVFADVQIVQETTDTPPSSTVVPSPIISGTYEDPQGRFQIGILNGYIVSSVSGSPLLQNADGSLAYSVVRVPLNSEAPIPDIGLVEFAQQTLNNGEGFQTQTFTLVPGGGLQIAWSGRLSQGGTPPQPISGTALAKQQGTEVYLLVIAALESGVSQVPQLVSLLSDSLTIL